MRAMVLEHYGPVESGPLRLKEVARPEAGQGEVRVKVVCCAVCRTDLHVIEGELPHQKLPVIPGHMVVGKVESLGPGCETLKVGERVGIAWLRHACGVCEPCWRGRENLCENSLYTGYHTDGGYAEYALVPEAFAYRLPQEFDDLHAAPLLCSGIIGYRALQRAAVPKEGRLLLVGFGSSAHLILQIAVHRGHQVHVLTRSAAHQEMARELGAAWAGADADGIPEKVDSAIVFAPAGELVPATLEVLKPGGVLSLAGIHMSTIPPLDYGRHLYGERDIHSVTANTREDGRALLAEAAAARVRVHVTPYPFADANRALADLKHSRVDGTAVLVV